ncbi:hypothetical protein [Dyella solisilvae]|uniref:hypothetical protein n=1 Tax=Dyella solisilvae TaxID=1920168 RepID=UPI0011C03E0B|nr:hypothetical protein [Dyella solisilvae]
MTAFPTVIGVIGIGMLLTSAGPALSDTANAQNAGCSMATVKGPYAIYGQGTVFVGSPPQPGLEVDVGTTTLDGRGKLTGSLVFSFNGKILRTTFVGDYVVNPDCTMRLAIQDSLGEHLQQEGVVIGNGDEVRFIGTDPGRVIARVAKRMH